jgi:FkbM family methyltransferase
MLLGEVFFRTKTDGFYVDVGAFHPVLYSNTFALHKRGWQGINIDPNQETINLFQKYRPRDINLAIGIGSKSKKDYYRFALAGGNTFSLAQKQNLDTKQWSHYLGSTVVECIPLRDVLGQYSAHHIDLLTVDVEGMDLEVLESNDWNTFRPTVVLVEDTTFDVNNPSASAIYALMQKNKYALRGFLGVTLVFQTKIYL